MSFAMTALQVENETKTVTRRIGWANLQVGTHIQPVLKGQGLKKGDKVQTIGGPIRVIRVTRERLDAIKYADVQREGFHGYTSERFIEMFCAANRCTPSTIVTRIEFTYQEPKR